jgi:hypothetical protein
LSGKLEAKSADCAPLAGKSTLNRLEHAPGAIKPLGRALASISWRFSERGNGEAWVGALGQVLGLAADPPAAAPGVEDGVAGGRPGTGVPAVRFPGARTSQKELAASGIAKLAEQQRDRK